MKTYLASAILLLAASQAQAETLVPLKDSKLPFKMSYPQKWIGIYPNDKTQGVSMVSSKKSPFTMIRMLFVPHPKSTSVNINKAFNALEKDLQASGVEVKRVYSKKQKYDKIEGIERELKIFKNLKHLVTMRVWIGKDAKNTYSFQLTDTPKRFLKSSPLFSKVLATVRF